MRRASGLPLLLLIARRVPRAPGARQADDLGDAAQRAAGLVGAAGAHHAGRACSIRDR